MTNKWEKKKLGELCKISTGDDWEEKQLGEVCEISAGNSAPQNKELFIGGKHPFIRTSDVGKIRFGIINDSTDKLNDRGIKKLRLNKKGTLLFPKSGASTFLNHRVLMGVDGYVSSHLATIKAKENVLEDRFLLYFSSTIDSRNLMQDQNYPSLRLSDIQNINILLPSLEEQKRIVSILDEAFAGIKKAKENAEKNLVNAREIFECSIRAIFDSKRKQWDSISFDDAIEDSLIGLVRNKKEQSLNNEYRYLKMNNIKNSNGFDESNCVHVNANKKEVDKYSLKNRDFLFNTRNSFELVGKSCIYSSTYAEPTLFNNNIMRVRFKSLLLPEFVAYAFSSTKIKEDLEKMKSGTTNVVGIYYKSLKNLQIPIPSFDEQKTIVGRLNSLNKETQKLENIYQQKANDLEELKKSILRKTFNGELKRES